MNRRPMCHAAIVLIIAAAAAMMPALVAGAAPGPGYDLKFAGVITTVPAQSGDSWEIGGQIVAVNALTRIRLTTGVVTPGMWADVTAKRQSGESLLALQIVVMPPEMRLKGPISAIPEGGLGAWIVAGQEIQVSADTRISERGGPLEVDAWAEVYAIEEPAGVLTATRIRGIEAQENVEVYGAVQNCSDEACMLSAVPLVVNPETLISDDPQIGLLAHASAALQDDGALLALKLKVEWQEPAGARPSVQFVGLVQSLPPHSLNGVWLVDEQQVVVTPSTAVIQVKGLVEVGARVEVVGWSADGRIVAAQVTVLWSPSGVGFAFRLVGPVESMPENGVLGTWTIAGVQVQVTRQTRLHGAEQIRLGEPVEVGGLQLRSGVRVATWLRTRTQGGQGPQPTVTPNPSHTPSHTPQPSGTPGSGAQPTRTPQPGRTPNA